MDTIKLDTAFHAALQVEAQKKGRGVQVWLAERVGVTPQYVYKLIKGGSYGTEETRRKIAHAFGYNYESFLQLGLSLINESEEGKSEGERLLAQEAKECPTRSTNIVREKILIMLDDLDEEEERDVLNYIEKAKHKRALEKRIKQLEARLDEGTSKEAG